MKNRWMAYLFLALAISLIGWPAVVNAQDDAGLAEVVKPAERDPERWENARCNDGTPFAFTIQLSPSGSNDWVIHLQGGGACSDCLRRAEQLITTLQADDGATIRDPRGDLFSRDASINPTFHEANFVLAHYCSSDLWSGTRTDLQPVPLDAEGWYFSGQLNVRAMLELLIDQYGLDDSNPDTEILFAGSSAGGVGVLVNAAMVSALLPETARADRLRLVNDAGFAADIRGLISEEADENTESIEEAYHLWGSQLNAACEQARQNAGGVSAECFLGIYSYPFIGGDNPGSLHLPYLVQESQFDTALLNRAGLRRQLRANLPALVAIQDATLETLEPVAWVFSGGDEPYHTLLPNNRWLMSSPDGVTFRDLLTRFWQDDTPERIIWGRGI